MSENIEQQLELYRQILLIRLCEKRIQADWFNDDMKTPVHMGIVAAMHCQRDIWGERLLWMALWVQASQARKPLPWREFLILARELQHGASLQEIPLMVTIATRSVQSAWQRAQLR